MYIFIHIFEVIPVRVDLVGPFLQPSRVQGEESPCRCLMPKNRNTQQSDERRDKNEKGDPEKSDSVSAGQHLPLSTKAALSLLYPRLILLSAYGKLATALAFPLQIKDQSSNIFFSFSIRLWLKSPPLHFIHTITLLGKRRNPLK